MEVCKMSTFCVLTHHVICTRTPLLTIVLYLLFLECLNAQTSVPHNIPPTFNVAANKPVTTVPAQSICGVPDPSAYCQSNINENYITTCLPSYCVQACPWPRSTLPLYVDLSDATGYSICVSVDTINIRPGTPAGTYATVFLPGTDCYLTPRNSITLGTNGAMTLTFWLWQNTDNFGTVIEKWAEPGDLIFRLRVSQFLVTFEYSTVTGIRQVNFLPDNLPSDTWNFLAIQVYSTQISIFINGLGLGYSAAVTNSLTNPILDEPGLLRLGADKDGDNPFLGRLQEVHFFSDTLSNREIEQVYSGILPMVHLQNECLCPPSHPRLSPIDVRKCIRNGVPDNTGDHELRLDEYAHPLGYLNDGSFQTYYISNFLDDVTIMIDFGDEFTVFHVNLQFYSPQPKVLTIERCRETVCTGASSWLDWQFYAEDCTMAFNMVNNGALTTPSSVNCIQFGYDGRVVPYSNSNITFTALSLAPQPRPGNDEFYNTPEIQEFVLARQVRIRMQDHYYVTHARHRYYGLYDIHVSGRCNCHGHAGSCDASVLPYVCNCLESSHVVGDRCEACAPLYNNKPYRDGDPDNEYPCRQCNCNNHAVSCVYDISVDPFPSSYELGGGGVCVNCQHNTQGINCGECISNFYRPLDRDLSAENVCEPCECYTAGTLQGADPCNPTGGQCDCRENVAGRDCSQCQDGYFNLLNSNLQGCEACGCNAAGTVNGDITCHQTVGQCNCKLYVQGRQCDSCQSQFYGLSAENEAGCLACNCNPETSLMQACNEQTGDCYCRSDSIGGRQCDQCNSGYFNISAGCLPCDCEFSLTQPNTVCNSETGQCLCLENVAGIRCDSCDVGYYWRVSVEACTLCTCDPYGTLETDTGRSSCDPVTGTCHCKSLTQGGACNQCQDHAYNLARENPEGCLLCDCDETGTSGNGRICNINSGECTCLARRIGPRCDQCETGYYKSSQIGGGCLPCVCNPDHTLATSINQEDVYFCDMETGECACEIGYGGRDCSECHPEYYEEFGSCVPCNCAPAGSLSTTCDSETGQCQCKSRVTGRTCDQCEPNSSNLQASNPEGCSSDPTQQPPPDAIFVNSTAILLAWDEPDNPNGVILSYELYRDGNLIVIIFAPTRQYLDDGLEPFTEYQYRIKAANAHSSTWSPVVTFITQPDAPTGDFSLQAFNVGSESASFQWSQPTMANGIIQSYELLAVTLVSGCPIPSGEVSYWQGLAMSYTLTGLFPYTRYQFHVRACNPGGCLESDVVTVETLSAPPEGQAAPSLSKDANTITATWNYPECTNGVVYFYELWIRGTANEDGVHDPLAYRALLSGGCYDPWTVGATVNSVCLGLQQPALTFQVLNLQYYKKYDLQVIVENEVSKSASEWETIRTAPTTPLFVPPPEVLTVNSTHVNVTWRAATEEEARGAIFGYFVNEYDVATRQPIEQHSVRMVLSFVHGPFLPYTEHMYSISMATSGGLDAANVFSEPRSGFTAIGAPTGQQIPIVNGINASIMAISWDEPLQLNGPQPSYVIRRTDVSFNQPPMAMQGGVRFVGVGYYMFPPSTIPQGVSFTGFDFWFKTFNDNGLLFFATSEGQQEFVMVMLRNKRPWFVFDPQGCITSLEPDEALVGNMNLSDNAWHRLMVLRFGSSATMFVDDEFVGCSVMVTTTDDEGLAYSNGEWHHFQAWRTENRGSIMLDDEYTGETSPGCTTDILGYNTGLYIGGVPEHMVIQGEGLVTQSYAGCLREVRILMQRTPQESWEPLDWSTALFRDQAIPTWQGCPTSLEKTQIHLLGNGFARYDPVLQFSSLDPGIIDLSFKTTLSNGLLWMLYTETGGYLLAQIQDGGFYFEYSNVEDFTSVYFPPTEQINPCDGQVHALKLNYNLRTQIRVYWDFELIPSMQINPDGFDTFYTTYIVEIMIGGIEPFSRSYYAVIDGNTRPIYPFGGCMQETLQVGGEFLDLKQDSQAAYNVRFDGCPNQELSGSCMAVEVQEIYSGPELNIDDINLPAFTEFMYQVEAHNSAGSNFSQWTAGRTREGAPVGVLPPTSAEVLSGTEVNVTWLRPTQNTGRLTEFRVLAYQLENPDVPPVVTVFPSNAAAGLLTNAIPFTQYNLRLVACTMGGCTESDPGPNVTTFQMSPMDVAPPVILDQGATYLTLGWTEPGAPNGVLTGYILYQGNTELYSGNLLSYIVSGLNPYTAYQFRLSACTSNGCTPSEDAVLSTSQLPPAFVEPPILTVYGAHRIMAYWSPPEVTNGVLERYVLYASTIGGNDLGVVVNNDSLLFTDFSMEGLQAGTTYFVTLAACTGGGCAFSEAHSATTAESSPEGVPDPVVVSPSPSQLFVTWGQPEYPNGVITHYHLYHNGLLKYTGLTVREYSIDNLMPWSFHTFRVEACTNIGCGSSEVVEARTMEMAPVGVVGLTLVVLSPREVGLTWNTPAQPNGLIIYSAYFEGLFYIDPGNFDYTTETARRSLYESEERGQEVVVDGLIPYSVYQVQINASNTQGFILSNTETATMPMGAPDGVAPPILTSPSSTSVRATWSAVGRDNADVAPTFQLQFRESTPGAQIQDLFGSPTTSTTFLKEGLTPFTSYDFRLVASNPYGFTRTEWTMITTRQDFPGNIDPPILTNILSRSIDLNWHPPSSPNGILTQYHIYQNGVLRNTVSANDTTLVADGLTPYTAYVFRVAACTIAGCTTSQDSISAHTLRAPPEGMTPPTLISETPTSVLIVWDPPEFPNGVLLTYAIERRLAGEDTVIAVATLPAVQRQYTDSSPEISPYTTYEYRIIASTEDGDGESPWAEVTTRSSTPGGVRSPQVIVTSPRSLNISWEPPISSNGILEYYIIKLPSPRFEIYDTTQTSLFVDNLQPFTDYYVSIIACSDGGCTESLPTLVTTFAAVPSGQDPPLATPHSQTFISLLWEPPEEPNGPSIRYELSRTKVAQPLQPLAEGFGTWTSLYNGPNMYYEDRALTIYTTYRYRVTVFNDFGQLTSEPTANVTTFGGVPTVPPTAYASAINHTALQVWWDTPNVFELQGGVSRYVVSLTSAQTGFEETYEYDSDVPSTVLDGLTPTTLYTVVVTLDLHGDETISSSPVSTTTLDGAPEGLAPPVLIGVDDTTLRVVWSAPTAPNGQVTGYFIYVDGNRVETGMITPGSYLISDLLPYRIYTIQLEVCTTFACLRSDEVIGTTAEALPGGVASPTTIIQGPTAVRLNWQPPSEPNGIILQYELFRKAYVPCDQSSPTQNIPETSRCSYVQCDIQESLCGAECYSGAKTCCDGVLHDNRVGYECCGTRYIPQRSSPTDVCCGGQFFTLFPNYECCGDRYVEVPPGQICCPDPYEDRVAVGNGDQCCSSVPFSSSGAQICCNDILVDRYEQQCCGNELVPGQQQCCGNGTAGQAYDFDGELYCCGQEYVNSQTTACCSGLDGSTQVHEYSSYLARISANEKCCGTSRISVSLSCCNSVGYNPFTQVCADVSDGLSACGSGTVCPVSLSALAYCDTCNFDRNQYNCGSAVPMPVDEDNGQPADYCWTSAVRLYQGLELTYLDESLNPFSRYEYAVAAVNAAGSGLSIYTPVLTLPSVPEGVSPPRATIDPSRLDTIYLSWSPPATPNGEIIQYILQRDDVEMFRDPSALSYVDSNTIYPYHTYTYLLSACTIQGCTTSEPIQVATLQAAPENVLPPDLAALSSTAIQVTWQAPGSPNGFIMEYRVVSTTLSQSWSLDGSTSMHTVSGLTPYTQYEFLLTACTQAGCTNSSTVDTFTRQDLPLGLEPPRFVVLTATSMEIYWQPPETPNGVIENYKLFRSRDAAAYQLVYMPGSAGVVMVTENDLSPATRYNYIISAINGVGSINSSVSTVDMPENTPIDIQAPAEVSVRSATQVYVRWEAPIGTALADIDQFRVILDAGTPRENNIGTGTDMEVLIDRLRPNTQYSVRIQACLAGVENGCGTGPAVLFLTQEAVPVGLDPPILTARGPSVIDLEWSPPTEPNGAITQYYIHRRSGGSTGSGLLVNIVSGTTLSFTNAGPELLPFTTYQYKITAVNSQGNVASDWASVRTLESPPRSLDPPTVLQVDAFSIAVAWQPPQYLNGDLLQYRLEWRPTALDPTQPVVIVTVTLGPGILTTSISGLTPHTEYQARVVAINSAGEVASNWVVLTTGEAAPADFRPFQVDRISSGTAVVLHWDEPGQPNGVINNYLVFEEGNFNAVYQGLSREFQYSRLQPYTEYTVQLEACTLGGCGRSAPQSFTTAEVSPANLPTPTVGSVTADSATLVWTPPVNPNGQILMYQVLRQSTSLARRRKRQADDGSIVVYETDDTDQDQYTYTDTGLQPYTQYGYTIRAINSQGQTDSPVQIIETDQAAPTGVDPPRVTYVSGSPDQLDITWSPPQRANGVLQSYLLQRNESVPWSILPSDPLEYRDSGLLPFTVYSYTVTVYSGGGHTTSEPTIVVTAESAPYFVDPPSLTPLSSTAIQAVWQAPQITNGRLKEFRLQVDGSIQYLGLDLQYSVENLTPFQLYTFVLVACTFGGCTSSAAVTGRPAEAPPSGLAAPVLRVTSSNSIEVSWQPPTNPNGVITSYELRRDGTLVDSTTGLLYVDYEVLPGQEYSYRVTAFNSQGSVESPPAAATTYASSPSGMDPPLLEAVTAASIRATWSPPLQPNGDIHNYTLLQDGQVVYVGMALTSVIGGLSDWRIYSYRIQACTVSGCSLSEPASIRTLESIPTDMDPPDLTPVADAHGAHAGVLVEWIPPDNPNGVITKYEVYRRPSTGLPPDVTGGVIKLLFSGQGLSYLDEDPELDPFSWYEYQAVAYNSAGSAASLWTQTMTMPAAPTSVPAPRVQDATSDTMTLEILAPAEPNGRVESYHVFLDGQEVTQSGNTVVILTDLIPSTTYQIYVRACTGGGCTNSSTTTGSTDSIRPAGLSDLELSNITSTSIVVAWQPPTQPNGEILNYELSYRRDCPPPYAESLEELEVFCTVGEWVAAVRSPTVLSKDVTGLNPYSKYSFKLEVENAAGISDPVVTTGQTLPALPEYIPTIPLRLIPSGNIVNVNWTNSFAINGEVQQFILYTDGRVAFAGIATSHNILRDPLDQTYHFHVRLVTTMGEAESPIFTFSPSGEVGVLPPTAAPVSSTTPVYQEVWFIVLILIVLFIIVILTVICCMRNTKRSRPYIRERAPLQPASLKAPLSPAYLINPYNGSIVSDNLHRAPSQMSIHAPSSGHPGYMNPAYSQMSLASRTASLVDLNLDKLSMKSSKWDDDEPDWEGHLPPDSGLHSLAYGEEYDTASDRPISVLKEHTMFTDTHI